MTRAIATTRKGVIEGLTQGSEQMNSASNQVAQSSQRMARPGDVIPLDDEDLRDF